MERKAWVHEKEQNDRKTFVVVYLLFSFLGRFQTISDIFNQLFLFIPKKTNIEHYLPSSNNNNIGLNSNNMKEVNYGTETQLSYF